ncbi:MAG: DUF4339 domain-containing protein [Fibromonadaceae bacterium]|jgi:hypothetical protein|nr:DUF4339 domain-containing protein [Fibromonadaceae bacterium]
MMELNMMELLHDLLFNLLYMGIPSALFPSALLVASIWVPSNRIRLKLIAPYLAIIISLIFLFVFTFNYTRVLALGIPILVLAIAGIFVSLSAVKSLRNQEAKPVAPAASSPVAPVAPTDALKTWHMAINNQQQGPFTVKELVLNGLSGDSLVWKEGMANWVAAREIGELKGLV